MLIDLFPRAHARFSTLPLLGPQLDAFVSWLWAKGLTRIPIRCRIRKTLDLDALLRRRGVRELSTLSRVQLLRLAPRDSQDDVYLSALIRSLVNFLEEQELLVPPEPTPGEQLVAAYRDHLDRVRGLARSTVTHHGATASELLEFLGFDADPSVLCQLSGQQIEAFVRSVAPRLCRTSLQHTVAHLRSFLRFLASRGEVSTGLDASIDTPRVYRGERLPRALSWEIVQAFLSSINRTSPMGRRDYAMFLLITTFGLRTSEVAALRLDDIEWRAGRVRVPRPKAQTPIVLPLTDEVGAALLDYLQHARPTLPYRELFLRVRAPAGPLLPTAVSEAFQRWSRRSGLDIPYQGPHCLRHSLAVHLLRQGATLKAIGDLLGHRSPESTCVYLRLHIDDLRDTSLDLPTDTEVDR